MKVYLVSDIVATGRAVLAEARPLTGRPTTVQANGIPARPGYKRVYAPGEWSPHRPGAIANAVRRVEWAKSAVDRTSAIGRQVEAMLDRMKADLLAGKLEVEDRTGSPIGNPESELHPF